MCVVSTVSHINSYLLRAVSQFSLSTFLQSKVLEAETCNENLAEEKNTYAKLLKEEQESALQNETRVIFRNVCSFM